MPEIAPYRHRGSRAIERMVEFAPSTGALALWVRHLDQPAAAGAAPVSTDGITVSYGAAFEALPLPRQVGWVAHEVLHIALRHPQRYLDLRAVLGDVDLGLFNICADAIVNSALSHLAWLELPPGAVMLERLLSGALGVERGVEKALLEWDVERLYRAIDDRPAAGRGARREGDVAEGGSAGTRPGSGSGDTPAPAPGRPDGPVSALVRHLGADTLADLAPGPATRGLPEADAEAAREWSERLVRAHAGDGAHSMLRTLVADLPAVRTPWRQVLRSVLARGLAARHERSWSRPARSWIANQGRIGGHRMPWEPGVSGMKPVPRLVVVVDVSGSIDDALLRQFAAEIEAVTRRLEAGLVLVVGDDEVRSVSVFEPGRSALRDIAFTGGGGTDFTPLLEEADRHDPDLAIVLTDLEGPAHFRPRWPVWWAVPGATHPVPPFGRVLALQ